MFAGTNEFGIKNAFLQIGDDDLLQVNGKGAHEILHQVMGQRPAGMHFLQGHGNGLRLKTTDHDRQAAKPIDLTQNHRIRMRLRNAMRQGYNFQFDLLHKTDLPAG